MPSRIVLVRIMHRDFEDEVVEEKPMAIDFFIREITDAIENAASAISYLEKDRMNLPLIDVKNHCVTLRKLSEHIISPFDFTLMGINYSVVEELDV